MDMNAPNFRPARDASPASNLVHNGPGHHGPGNHGPAAAVLCRAMEESGLAAALLDNSLGFAFSTAGFRRRLGHVSRATVTTMPDLLDQTSRLSGPAATRLLEWLATQITGQRNTALARFPTTDGGQVAIRLDPLGSALWLAECLPGGAADSGAAIHDAQPFDQLTGLAGRERLLQQLEDRLNAQPMPRTCLLMFDITQLRVLNDRHGAQIGDQLLCAVARRLAKACREGDVLVRTSGDQFCLMLPGLAADEAQRHAETLLELLQRPYPVAGNSIGVSICIGIAEVMPGITSDPGDVAAPLRHARLALRLAKVTPRRLAVFEPAMVVAEAHSARFDSDLHLALAAGEFVLHFQPLVALHDRCLTGFEALLRWNRGGVPGGQLVPPNDFIPALERLGLIEEVGAWVLRAACAEAATWPAGLRVSVNVSPLQVAGGGVMAAVRAALDESGLPPHRLELEITETSVLRAEAATHELLAGLRATGVRIALDDFGTGYASLSQIANFPFDRLKIDRSFIRMEGSGMAIVRAAVHLGEELGMDILAEGIETEGELARARAAGCGEGQGWLFGRPVASPALPALFAGFATRMEGGSVSRRISSTI